MLYRYSKPCLFDGFATVMSGASMERVSIHSRAGNQTEIASEQTSVACDHLTALPAASLTVDVLPTSPAVERTTTAALYLGPPLRTSRKDAEQRRATCSHTIPKVRGVLASAGSTWMLLKLRSRRCRSHTSQNFSPSSASIPSAQSTDTVMRQRTAT